MFTDTHTHPYYNEDPAGFVNRAIEAGVTRMILPNVDLESLKPMEDLAAAFPDNLRTAVGLHPTEVKENADETLELIFKNMSRQDLCVAVGEIGIDLYWDKTFRDKQMEIFDRQLYMAQSAKLPVIIHCREGLDETLEVISGHRNVRAVFHSFGGSEADVDAILKISDDFYFGINGIVTFKNSNLRQVLPAIPITNILLETDSPYLAPVPKRGKPNESAYLPYIARTVAEVIPIPYDEIARVTAINSQRLFGF